MNEELKEFFFKNKKNNWVPKDLPMNIWQSDWPWAPLFVNNYFEQEFLDELTILDDYFVFHRSKDKFKSYGHEGWQSVTIHGIEYDKTEDFSQYGFKSQDDAGYTWTSVCKLIPKLTEFIKSLPFKNYGRIRIMKLSPNGYIMPHTDGTGRIFGPFNFALTNPNDCEFVFENYGTVPFKPGRGFILDLGIKHAVWNNSDKNRYHLIIHGESCPNIQLLISESLKQL